MSLGALALSATVIAGACGTTVTDGDGPDPDPASECEQAGIECAVFCSATLGCVECLADADCGAASPFCVQGACAECNGNEGCGESRRCFPATHQCEDACETNDDCPAEAPTCDTATGACLGCVDASDCDDALCHPSTRQCVECMSDLDCGVDKPVCDGTGTCRECLVDASCPTDAPLCMDHECLEAPEGGCESNSECEDDEPVCHPQSGECVGCISNRDCGPSTPFCEHEEWSCVECLVDAHCPSSVPICEEGTCVECTEDEHCPEGFQCGDLACEPE